MQFAAAASSSLRSLLAGPARPARLLGAGPAALYLATAGEPAVLAVLTHDAVRLPCGIVLPATRAELPLTSVGPVAGSGCLVGDGRLSWTSCAGPVVVNIVREWPVVRVGAGRPVPAAVRAARHALRGRLAELPAAPGLVIGPVIGPAIGPVIGPVIGTAIGPVIGPVIGPAIGPVIGPAIGPVIGPAIGQVIGTAIDPSIAAGLLGRGPGLTPAGDDLLAGLLLGGLAFGPAVAGPVVAGPAIAGPAKADTARADTAVADTAVADPGTASLRAVIESLAPVQTTALSAALLRHAARGECIGEVAALAAALAGAGPVESAASRLLAVGHTSGAALALGLVLAAESAPEAAG
jgi:hypothetical protein